MTPLSKLNNSEGSSAPKKKRQSDGQNQALHIRENLTAEYKDALYEELINSASCPCSYHVSQNLERILTS